MDRERLLNQAPTSEELLGAPDSRRKELAKTYVAGVLDAFEADHNEPDTWEAAHIYHAIGDIVAGRYVLSVDETMCALTPAEERGEMHEEPVRTWSVRSEAAHIYHAIGDIVAGRYVLSVDETMCALTPAEERGEMHEEPVRTWSV